MLIPILRKITKIYLDYLIFVVESFLITISLLDLKIKMKRQKILTYPINSIVEFTTDYRFLLQQKYFIERHKKDIKSRWKFRNLSKTIDLRLKGWSIVQAYYSTTYRI